MTLNKKSVALIGVGALGTVIASRLVRAGVGELRLIDRDFVELSNLQRQILFDEQDVQEQLPKVIAAKNKLQRLQSETKLIAHIADVNPLTIEELTAGVDLILDGTDNMLTRFLINDVAIKHHIPWIYGGALQARGTTTTIIPGKTPCFRCLFHQPDSQHGQTCDTVGVLGPVVYLVASLQVLAALKLLTGQESLFPQQLLHLDLWNDDLDYWPIEQALNPFCPCCQQNKYEFLDSREEKIMLAQLCGRDSIQLSPPTKQQIDLAYWAQKWAPLGEVEQNRFLLRLHYLTYRLTLFTDGRLLIQGIESEQEAKKLYEQIMGN